ncbi:MAG TPA: DUF2326 domain-containing protein [Holosporales bacterium]|nr:DUF2326 domain-containing protein [Holosporales bacterium]
MIHGIHSNKPSFKSVHFDQGLNVIIAERQDESDKIKTINSRGKSTLISIINFCLGSNSSRSGLCIDALDGWKFTIDITLFENRVKVTRAVSYSNKFVIEGSTKSWPFSTELDEETAKHFLTLEKWKQLLGLALFNIPETSNLSIRSALSYFLRSGNDAYSQPLKFYSSQSNSAANIYNAFLIGLDPQHAADWVKLHKQNKALKALETAIKEDVYESESELEKQKADAESELQKSRTLLSNFTVHEKYKDIQIKANNLTRELHSLVNESMTDKQKLEYYEEATSEEKPPEQKKLESVYKEIGLIFPNSIKKTLEEALVFHETIIQNRSSFLSLEIEIIKNEIRERERLITTLTDMKSECMKVLSTHGALEEYSLIQEENTKLVQKLENISHNIKEIRNRSEKRQEIKFSKIELNKTATLDYVEKKNLIDQAISLFNEIVGSLYKKSGEFSIDISNKGYHFEIDIAGSSGGGIGKMRVFCYDLMIICMQSILERHINFLIHDSIIFEGVDDRQVAHAIEQASKKSTEHNFQYIMTINSDMVPYNDFSENFDFDKYIKLRLTDDEEFGCLLGITY